MIILDDPVVLTAGVHPNPDCDCDCITSVIGILYDRLILNVELVIFIMLYINILQ